MKLLHSLHKKITALLLASVLVLPLLFLQSAPALAEGEAGADAPAVKAEAAILIDADTGRVLWSKNGEERHYPASMTKMMTCLLGISLLPPDAKITISENAANTEDTPLHIAKGDVITAEELLRGMMMMSDNGAAVAIAEQIDGSTALFAERMNEKAAEIGMNDTHFANPNGLTDPNHYSTPHDMARLAQYGMKNPVFRDFVRQKERQISWLSPSGKTILAENTNELLGKYAGLTGVKTGWTKAAGGCLAASAERGGVHLIAVVMKSPTENDRFTDMRQILDYGFENVTLANGPTTKDASRHVWVKNSVNSRVRVHPAADIDFPVLPGEDAKKFGVRYEVPKVLSGPLYAGQVVGRAVITYDGDPVGSVDMTADEAPAGFGLGSWLVGLFEKPLSWF
ncbi:D-alanyl-D-alanine carboxypeptidase family protein [Mitsuokella sp.]|uniref:D-alanyl-D-alanine carboxypeptidase family protein n=1 Tax=Mitsuokella sp. TaxID=2049034 RepID=UPI003D7E75FD